MALFSKIESKFWRKTLLFSTIIFIAGSLYLFLRRGSYDLHIANKVLAVTALVLIGFSLVLSAICYFWDFADKQIIYRKYLGITGFAFASVHTIISLFFLPTHFSFPTHFLDDWLPFLAGLVALIILTYMASISNNQAIKKLGGKTWRKLMRITGYTALILTITHLTLLKYPGWLRWLRKINKLPPLSLIAFIFAISVLLLRLALWLSKKKS